MRLPDTKIRMVLSSYSHYAGGRHWMWYPLNPVCMEEFKRHEWHAAHLGLVRDTSPAEALQEALGCWAAISAMAEVSCS